MNEKGIRATDGHLTFQLKACFNAYVGLMSENSETKPLYEIDFGEYGNTVTFIRAGKFYKLPRLDEVEGEILNCDKYKDFMITWDAHTINVRHGLDDSRLPFLTWTSTTTLWPIRYIGISTSYFGDATGEWIFHTQGKEIKTHPDNKPKTEGNTSSISGKQQNNKNTEL